MSAPPENSQTDTPEDAHTRAVEPLPADTVVQSDITTNDESFAGSSSHISKKRRIEHDASALTNRLTGNVLEPLDPLDLLLGKEYIPRDSIIQKLKSGLSDDLFHRRRRRGIRGVSHGRSPAGQPVYGVLAIPGSALKEDVDRSRDGLPDPSIPLAKTLTDLSVRSLPKFLDIVEEFSVENIALISDRLLVENISSRWPVMNSIPSLRYIAIVRGKIPLPGFVLDAEGKIWHQLATSRFIIICDSTAHCRKVIRPPDDVNICHDPWKIRLSEVLRLSMNSMMITAVGIRNPSTQPAYNVDIRSVIALQTIREMVHWRYVIRSCLSQIPAGTTCKLEGLEPFCVAEQSRLSFNGETNLDARWLDPAKWKDLTEYAFGLLAWVNVPTTSIYDPAQLLRTADVRKCNSAEWARISVQFAGGRSREQAIVFVDLIRFLVIRHHVPAAGNPSLLCANEFLDRAVAIPELEACLPELLNVRGSYGRGHDIDTGAVTRLDLLGGSEFPAIAGSTARSVPYGVNSSTRRIYHDHRINESLSDSIHRMSAASGIGLRGLPRAKYRRVAMSVWTSPICGTEWTVPETVISKVGFTLDRYKYKLSVADGHVTCKRVGLLTRLKDQVRGVTQIQTPFLSVQREASRSGTPEASGAVAITNALSCAYGEEARRQMLTWLHRGAVALSSNCTAASFVPRSSHTSDVVVNQRLGYEICRQMIFGRRGHELYWLPGEGLPCFRVRDCPNGTYKVGEVDELPPGVELCRADLAKDFG